MPTQPKKIFLTQSEIKSLDFEHKRKMTKSIDAYDQSFKKSIEQYQNIDLAKKKAKNIKWAAIEKLDEYLQEFEKNFKANGGEVIWALNSEEAQQAVLEICKQHSAKLIVKSKSMVTEEIVLNSFLNEHNIETVETDLGEYVQQLDKETPYHMVTPAMHKSKEDVAKLFYNKLNTEANLTPQEITAETRKRLRHKFTTAQVGITGGNFLVADVGGLCLTENEGNARLSTAFPPIHIAIVGIEKMIASINDLGLFWPLLATYGTGQQLTVYNTLFTGPKQTDEQDGPTKMYVILLDNGRSKLIANPELRESTYCIRCGACLNVCPVYKNIGGHTYNSTYNGPIGSVITPHLNDFKNNDHLSQASTLCGSCSAACPVNINIHGMLHYNRTLSRKRGTNPSKENKAWKLWKISMKNRWFIDLGTSGLKTKIVNRLFKNSWPNQRNKLVFGKTFKQLYKQSNKK